jgi:hypothetical protein
MQAVVTLVCIVALSISCYPLKIQSSEAVVFVGNNAANVSVGAHPEPKPSLPWVIGRRREYVPVFNTSIDVGVRVVPSLPEKLMLIDGLFADANGFVSLVALRIFCVEGGRGYRREDYFQPDFFLYDPCWTLSFVAVQKVDIHSSTFAAGISQVSKKCFSFGPSYVDNYPSAFTVDKSIGTRLGSGGGLLLKRNAVSHCFGSVRGRFRLPPNRLKGATGDQNAPNSDQEEGPVCPQWLEYFFAPRSLLRLTLGSVLFFLGAWPGRSDPFSSSRSGSAESPRLGRKRTLGVCQEVRERAFHLAAIR